MTAMYLIDVNVRFAETVETVISWKSWFPIGIRTSFFGGKDFEDLACKMLRISSNVGNVAPLKTHSLLHSAQEDKGSQAKDSKNKNEEWWNIPYTPSPHGTVGFYTLNRMHPYLYLLVFCTATAGGPKCRMLTIPRSLELKRLYIVRLLYHFRDPFRARFNACGFRFRRHKLDQHDQLRLIHVNPLWNLSWTFWPPLN